MSYIEDAEIESDSCRVYGYSDAKLEQDSLTNRDWFTKEQLLDMLGDLHDICRVVDTWVRDDIIRGKGKAIHQRTEQFD